MRGVTSGGWAARVVLALVLLAFTCIYPYISVVNNPNENVRTYMTMAIVEHGTFRIDKIVERHGWVNDMAKAPDKKTGEHHLYSVKAPAISFAGVPVYWAFTKIAPRLGHPVPQASAPASELQWWFRATTFVLRLFVVQLPCFLFLVWLERFLRAFSRDEVLRLSTVIAAGLGTNYLAYSLMFVSHAPFACAAFAAFGLVTRERMLFPDDARGRRVSRAFLAGLFTGLATLLEYHALPVSAALAVWALSAFYRPRQLAALAVGGLLNVGALMFFQWRAFGSPLTPGHKMVENQAFAALHEKGLFGIGKPSFDVLQEISLSHSFGFFGTSPFMWLGLLSIPAVLLWRGGARFQREQARAATLAWVATMGLLWITVSAAINWRGGWTVGPRYLGAAPPFFAFGALVAAEIFAGGSIVRRTVARGVLGGLAIAGVLQMGVLGALYNTIPESVTRPLPQFVLPLVRAGFVPHHAGELFGFSSSTFWYVAIGAALVATLLAATVPARDRPLAWATRVLLVAAFAWLGLRPVFSTPAPSEGGDGGLEARRGLSRDWQPPGRDRITTLRAAAEQGGPSRACDWYRIADLERALGRVEDADRDEKRAGRARGECR